MSAMPDARTCPHCGKSLSGRPSFCGHCGHALPDELVGKVIDGRYRILERIGGGGMGEVYKVEHVRIGKVAAMKIIHGLLADNQELRRRFLREARAVSKLVHVNTVQVFDFGEYEGSLYLVMEYVPGRTLSAVLKESGRLPWPRAVHIAVQVCNALSEAHEKGVVHRDIKPENLILVRQKDGTDLVKVVDFGLARLKGDGDPHITAQGSILGTPYYMAPEQARGEEPDERTDIYSLGVVLYEMVAGTVPFEAPSPLVVLTRCLSEEPPPPTSRVSGLDLDPAAERVIMKALARDRADRFRSAEEFSEALWATLPDAPSSLLLVPPSGSVRRTTDSQDTGVSEKKLRREDLEAFERSLRRRRAVNALLLPLIMAALAAGGTYWYLRSSHRKAPSYVTHEVEPNNTTAQANPIASGVAVTGTIGKRLSATEADLDAYCFVLPDGNWHVDVYLWPQRLMDLSLTVYRDQGNSVEPIAHSQATGRSGAEALTGLRLPPGRYHVVVSQVVGPEGPIEGVSDTYKLLVRWRPVRPSDEQEPNDSVDTAQTILVQRIEGSLASPADVDCYALPRLSRARQVALVKGEPGLVMDCLVSFPRRGREDQGDSETPVAEVDTLQVLAAGSRRCAWPELPEGAKGILCVREPGKRPEASDPTDLVRPYVLEATVQSQPRLHTSGTARPSPPGRPGSLPRSSGK